MTNCKIVKVGHVETKIYLISVLSLLYLILSFKFQDVFSDSIRESLKDSYYRIIPSMFPLMVLSKFMIESDTISVLEVFLGKAVSRIYGVSEKSSGGIILGLISGFPIGTMTVSDMYERGEIGKNEAEKLLLASHNAGPAFPIAAIGFSLWGSKTYGTLLYFSQLIAGVMVVRALFKTESRCKPELYRCRERKSIGVSLVTAIVSASVSSVNVVGFVTFWRGMTDLIFHIIPRSSIFISHICAVLFEFASGSLYAYSAGGPFAAFLTGLAVGFGGLSAICQAICYTSKVGLSTRKMITGKLLQGILCGLLSVISYFVVF